MWNPENIGINPYQPIPQQRTTIPENQGLDFSRSERQQLEEVVTRCAGAVCQVLTQDGTRGTGCLILNTYPPVTWAPRPGRTGTALLLTNHHILPDRQTAERSTVRFFQSYLPSGRQENEIAQSNIGLDPDTFFLTRDERDLNFTVVALTGSGYLSNRFDFVFSIFDTFCPNPATPNCVIREPGTTHPNVDLSRSYGRFTPMAEYLNPDAPRGAVIDPQGRLIALNNSNVWTLIQKVADALAEARIGAPANELGHILPIPDSNLNLAHAKHDVENSIRNYGWGNLGTVLSLYRVGAALNRLGRHEEALTYCQQALEISRRLVGDNRSAMADSLNGAGTALNSLGRHEEALARFRSALGISTHLFQGHRARADSLHGVGTALNNLGHHEEALTHFEQVLEIVQREVGFHPSTKADCLHGKGIALNGLGRHRDALTHFKNALNVRRGIEEDHPSTAESYHMVGMVLNNLGEHREAIENFEQALRIREATLSDHPATADTYHMLGMIFGNTQNYHNAFREHTRALEIRKRKLVANDPKLADSYYGVGFALNRIQTTSWGLAEEPGEKQVRCRKALQNHEMALEIRTLKFGYNHLSTADSHEELEISLNNLGRHEEAQAMHQRALKIRQRLGVSLQQPT